MRRTHMYHHGNDSNFGANPAFFAFAASERVVRPSSFKSPIAEAAPSLRDIFPSLFLSFVASVLPLVVESFGAMGGLWNCYVRLERGLEKNHGTFLCIVTPPPSDGVLVVGYFFLSF